MKPNEKDALANRIYDALTRIVAESGSEIVGLGALRQALPDVPRDEFEAKLTGLYEDHVIGLIRRAAESYLTDEDREAAFWCGGEVKEAACIADFE